MCIKRHQKYEVCLFLARGDFNMKLKDVPRIPFKRMTLAKRVCVTAQSHESDDKYANRVIKSANVMVIKSVALSPALWRLRGATITVSET